MVLIHSKVVMALSTIGVSSSFSPSPHHRISRGWSSEVNRHPPQASSLAAWTPWKKKSMEDANTPKPSMDTHSSNESKIIEMLQQQASAIAKLEAKNDEYGAKLNHLKDSDTAASTSLKVETNLGTAENSQEVQVSVSRQPEECMRSSGRPLVRFVEHGLPEALQTHEMLVEDDGSNYILATQMEEGRLVRLKFDGDNGTISSNVASAILTLGASGDDQDGTPTDPFVGMHGVCKSELFPGRAWVTLQFINRICLVNIETMDVEATIVCPRELPDSKETVGGPHCATEANGKLYVCMKGGASCHGFTSTREMAEEATAHGVWRVDINPEDGNVMDEGTLFRVPATPVMCAVDGDGNCWVVTDANGSITKISSDAKCSGCLVDVLMPFHYALYHQTGPGLQIGPDGNPWFCILNGEGLVGKIDKDTLKVTIFELICSPWNPHPRICHISWDASNVLYAISSDLLDKETVNTMIRVKFDPTYEQVIAQHELALPTQESCVHRIAHIDTTSDPSVLVSELTQSQILQVFKSTLPPLETFPAKTMQLNIRRVYDALKPCPRTGNPVCMCEFDENAIAFPEEPEFEGQEVVFQPEILAQGEPYVNPRTGQKQILIKDGWTWPNELMLGYPHSGFDPSELQNDIYAANGATKRKAAKPPPGGAKVGSNLGGKGGVLKYYPEKLKELLMREPSRIPYMTREIEAAGLSKEEILDFVQQRAANIQDKDFQ